MLSIRIMYLFIYLFTMRMMDYQRVLSVSRYSAWITNFNECVLWNSVFNSSLTVWYSKWLWLGCFRNSTEKIGEGTICKCIFPNVEIGQTICFALMLLELDSFFSFNICSKFKIPLFPPSNMRTMWGKEEEGKKKSQSFY